eukprot:gene5361-9169_t
MSFFRKNPKGKTMIQPGVGPRRMESLEEISIETRTNAAEIELTVEQPQDETLRNFGSTNSDESGSPSQKPLSKNQSVNVLISNFEKLSVEEQKKRSSGSIRNSGNDPLSPNKRKSEPTKSLNHLSSGNELIRKKKKCQEAEVMYSHEAFYDKIKENYEKKPFIETPDDPHFFLIDDEDLPGLEIALEVNPDVIHLSTTDGLTLLHFAAYRNLVPFIKTLIYYGADINSRTFTDGYSPMHLSVLCNNRESTYYFIQEGGGSSKSHSGFTPFLLCKNEVILSDFLLFGFDINQKNNTGQTLLHLFSMYRPEKVQFLLKMGADPNIRDDNGYTPIFLCILMRSTLALTDLVQGSNLTLKNNFGQNIVHLCLLTENFQELQELQNKKPNTIKNIFDSTDLLSGRTPLHYAVILKLDHFLSFLSMLDANLDVQDKNGDTAIHLSIKNDQISSSKILMMGLNSANLEIKNKDKNTPKVLMKNKQEYKVLLKEMASGRKDKRSGSANRSLTPNESPSTSPDVSTKSKKASFSLSGSQLLTYVTDDDPFDLDDDLTKKVFATEIEEIMKREDETEDCPKIYKQLIQYVKENGIQTPGVFRISGDTDSIASCRLRIDKGEEIDWNLMNIFVATSLLKLFLKLMPTPMLTFKLYSSFLEILGLEDDEKIEKLKNLISELNHVNQVMLNLLMDLMVSITDYSKENLMTETNLAVVIGLNILHPQDDDPVVLMTESPKITSVCTSLINLYPKYMP